MALTEDTCAGTPDEVQMICVHSHRAPHRSNQTFAESKFVTTRGLTIKTGRRRNGRVD
jgi:hypothetical protein